MAEALILTDEQAEELDAVGFQRSSPERNLTAEYERRRNLVHYGCSPAFDVDIRDRNVLPPGQSQILRCNLVEFKGVNVAAEGGGGEVAPPDVEMDAQGNPLPGLYRGPGNRVSVRQKQKPPGDCAEEMRYAYGDANPWGFQVFDALTGMRPEEAFNIFRSVLPRRMNLPEMVTHLESLGEMDGAAESVRLQLLNGCEDAANFSRETLEGSIQERADRMAGSQGKAKFDGRDRKLAAALNVTLPNDSALSTPTPAQVQTPAQTGMDPAALDAMLKTAEENGRLKAELAAKAPAGRAKGSR